MKGFNVFELGKTYDAPGFLLNRYNNTTTLGTQLYCHWDSEICTHMCICNKWGTKTVICWTLHKQCEHEHTDYNRTWAWMLPIIPEIFKKKLLAYRSWDKIFRAGHLKKSGPITSRGKRFCSSPKNPNWLWGPSGPLINGHMRGSLDGYKVAMVWSSPPFSANIKNKWVYSSTSPNTFTGALPLPCTPALPKFEKCQYLGFMYECASKYSWLHLLTHRLL